MKASRTIDFPARVRTETSHREGSAVVIIDSLLQEAYAERASDIHLDPGSGTFIARLRVDGLLYDAHHLSPYLHSEILSRLKILAGLRTDEHQAPQDGRLRFDISEIITIDVRISIAPTYYGENAVLRLLSSSNALSTLSSLGCGTGHEALIRQTLYKPHGMILVTGPTGSGKTSTLYALIQLLNKRSTSIITIEDPIEYALEGINQIPANAHGGLSFAEGLRSILRQDPDVIGIGEIRDSETAALATNAALTGHLVLSTLHTTDAPTALPRLMDMGIEPYLISSTLSLVVSQRLVRRLCTSCRIHKPLREDQKMLLSFLPLLAESITHQYESKGCKRCNGTGAHGRVGIFEAMKMDDTLRDAVMNKTSTQEIFTLSLKQGLEPLLLDGLRKAGEGVVNLDEILRLVAE